MDLAEGKLAAAKTYSNVPYSSEEMEDAACTVCNSNTYTVHWQLPQYKFVRCRSCGHIYQTPRPTPGALAKRYHQSYFEYEYANEDNFLQLMLKGISDSGITPLLPARKPLRMLDIGCATGALLSHYHKQGWEVQGVEPCRPAAEYGIKHHGIPIHVGDLGSAKLQDHSYDLIHSSHVIEHVGDPREFLGHIHRLLTDDGYAVIVTPDVRGVQARLLRGQWRSAIADHLNLFSASMLRRLAAEAGLRVHKKCSWGGIAVGITLPFIKQIADRAAKRLNCGDVMLLLMSREKS